MAPPCPPFTPCWCIDHPGHPKCPPEALSIDHILWITTIIFMILLYILLYKKGIKE